MSVENAFDPATNGQLRERLERALRTADERSVRRLSLAGTSVAFDVSGDDADSVTLLLDRFPPRVESGGGPAEVWIELTPDQARRFSQGELDLPGRLFIGEIPFRGPARKYLAAHPILRRMLSSS